MFQSTLLRPQRWKVTMAGDTRADGCGPKKPAGRRSGVYQASSCPHKHVLVAENVSRVMSTKVGESGWLGLEIGIVKRGQEEGRRRAGALENRAAMLKPTAIKCL